MSFPVSNDENKGITKRSDFSSEYLCLIHFLLQFFLSIVFAPKKISISSETPYIKYPVYSLNYSYTLSYNFQTAEGPRTKKLLR